ncbi:unnamed protein product [Triticum aestivum]|uniref:F-box domain-containing protein n=1 Tax=Triticum aestivum TaxID=4565 RepID=A0A7H4LBJ2_WHEAT|nr:unnamed protein product [Triticum aestivum]
MPLPDELLEEIFLRLPPDESECLVRASLASKLWLGLLTGARFRGRYSELHGARPATTLGFFYTWPKDGGPRGEEPVPYPHFVPTTKFAARIPDDDEWREWEWEDYAAWDCRHGRVLFGERDRGPGQLIVWDPITADWTSLNASRDYTEASSRAAAVPCARIGCGHRSCYWGDPFLVVFVYLFDTVAYASVFEDTTRRRIETCSGLDLPFHARIEPMPPVLAGDALHFMLAYEDDDHPVGVLKYNVVSNRLSLIDAPCSWSITADDSILLMATEDGSLGFAHVDGLTLYLWSRQMGSDGVAAWTRARVIHLKELLPIQNPEKRVIRLVGSEEGSDVIFVPRTLASTR